MKRYRAALPALALAALALAPPAIPMETRDDSGLEEVLVAGEQPGPALWKVSKDDHVLYILGTVSPVPANLQWRSREVENVIAHADEILGEAGVKADISAWTAIRLLPSLMGLRKMPGGMTLRDLMTPELYARWSALKTRVYGAKEGANTDDGMERWRPVIAAGAVTEQALKKSGLSPRSPVWNVVSKQAKEHKVPISSRTFVEKLEKPRELIDEYRESEPAAEIPCMEAVIARLEGDVEEMRKRAVAWATGDIGTLRGLKYDDPAEICARTAINGPRLREIVDQVRKQVDDQWVNAAGYALLRNKATFAVLPMQELFDADGRLARLRASGYTIEAPEAR